MKPKGHSVCKGSEEHTCDEGSQQPTPIKSSPSSPGSVAGQERVGTWPNNGVRRLEFGGSSTPAEPSDQEPEPQPDQEKDAVICPLTIDYNSDHGDLPLHAAPAAVSWKDESHPSWVRIRTVMDSGAAQSVAPPSMAPGVIIEESPGSQRGQHYISASGGRLPNMGQQRLKVQTNEGRDSKVVYQIAEVSRPLTAVSQTCDSGNWVVYTPRVALS